MDSILQDAHKKAKLDLFGNADDNAINTKGVVAELRGLGHPVEAVYSTRANVVSKFGVSLIMDDNMICKLKSKPPIQPKK